MSQLVNAEVNSGNRNVVLASNYATRIRGGHALCLVGPGIEI